MASAFPDVVYASGPTYWNNSQQQHMLMPFTYSNGTLEIPVGTYPSGPTGQDSEPIGNAGVTIRLLGGINQVTSIGPRLQAFLRSKTWSNYKPTSDAITVASPAIITRVQQLSSNYLPSTWNNSAYKVNVGPWNKSNFIGPSSVYAFNKPLVLQMKGKLNDAGNAVTICITLTTSWDH